MTWITTSIRRLQPLALFLAWLIALIGSLGALFVGEVMGQVPCQLCWYQRCALFPLAIILAVGFIDDSPGVRIYGLPLAAVGGAVAAWHSLLYAGFVQSAISPCTQGGGASCVDSNMTLFGVIPLPFLSFVAFALISFLLIIARERVDP